jgi:tyrosinase
MDEQAIPELVGATERPITLVGQAATATLSVGVPTGPASLAQQAVGTAPRIYLNFENITGGAPISYAVYLNLPPGASPERHPELLAGVLPMFGVAEASRARGTHAGSGLHYALEVTDIIAGLQARNAWDPGQVRVTFVPNRPEDDVAEVAQAGAAPPIHVGRISVYHA